MLGPFRCSVTVDNFFAVSNVTLCSSLHSSQLRYMNESKMSESKDADNDEDVILNSTKEQLIKRLSPPRNCPPVEQSSPPSPANFGSSDKRKSPLYEGYEEAKAPPPSPAPGVQER